MIVTFVGGPHHGNHQSMEHPPLTVRADNVDGTHMQYKRRLSPANDLQQIAVQVFYAPIRMQKKEFTRLSMELRVPSDLG